MNLIHLDIFDVYDNENINRGKSDPRIDFLNDDPKEMTYGRRIALSLMDKKWYNPNADIDTDDNDRDIKDEEGDDGSLIDDFDQDLIVTTNPSLKKGWAFFEHQALYRYLVKPDDNKKTRKTIFKNMNEKFDRAEPGEDDDPSKLYPWFTLPHSQLGDFGLGIGLYFSTLRAFVFITFICGLISMYNIVFFASEEYDPVKAGILDPNVTFTNMFMIGSAVCHSVEWVPCPTCRCRGVDDKISSWGLLPPGHCALSDSPDGDILTFAKKNNCDGTPWQLVATNYATVLFMVISVIFLGLYMKREETAFDEDEQTAQDYSIVITNPPTNAHNPDEWRNFFYDNFDGAQVTVCTCAVENDMLVQTLAERRERVRSIQLLEPGISMDLLDLAKVAAEIERDRSMMDRLLSSIVPGIPEHFSRLVALKAKVEGLAQLEYPVTNVFITFETEDDQRNVLQKLTVGSSKTGEIGHGGDPRALSDPNFLFRNNRVLNVKEPEEPNAIRWQDLNAGWFQRVKKMAVTTTLTLVAIVVVAIIIFEINKISVQACAYAITISGMIFPLVAKAMTSLLELHTSESSKQASLYFKIVLFRWVTTAFVIFAITPFTDTISPGGEGIIAQVYALFISDMTITNLVQVFDPAGHFQRHFLAPRAKTQDSMNILFQGTPYELAERYTDMTKILLLGLFYCSIFPTSFFMCAISLALKYYVDRFNLLRTWKRAPQLGTSISKMSRLYFFSSAVCLMAVFCSYFWTGFPFDNLCENSELPINATYVGNFTLQKYPSYGGEFQTETITITDADSDYRYCNMDYFSSRPYVAFPFIPTLSNPHLHPREYMDKEQFVSTSYFGWSAFAFVLIIIIKIFSVWYKGIKKWQNGGYTAVGKSQGINFSDVPSRCAYIPQVTSATFAYPLIACKVDGLDEELLDFKDPDRTFHFYDLTEDAKKLLAALNIDDPPGFSIVKSWGAKND
eukprot:jgi/Psemu1/294887/fgenesh1_pm.35_\